MKKFLVYISLFFMVFIILDRAFGLCMDYMRDHAKGGETYMIGYAINHARPDILVLGSSRAYHHIIPDIIEDSLGLSCYNSAYNACSIIPMYCRYIATKKRSNLHIVIYEVYSDTDILESQKADNIDNIKIYYDNQIVYDIYNDIAPNNYLKMFSSFYRYNSKTNGILKDYLKPTEILKKGYCPFFKEMNYEPEIDFHHGKIDEVKIKYLKKLIDDTQKNGIMLLFTVSPWYGCIDESEYSYIKDLCAKEGVPYISHLTDKSINQHKEYFADQAHLNDKGARLYTKMLASDIKRLLKK